MPAEAVNHTVLPAEYAVPIASFALCVHRGGMPGAPKARVTPRTIAMSEFDARERWVLAGRVWSSQPAVPCRSGAATIVRGVQVPAALPRHAAILATPREPAIH